MSVHSGRRQRQLLPTTMAFSQLERPSVRPVVSFEKTSMIALLGIVLGTGLSTMGILYKQTMLIIIGFVEMVCIVLWLVSYS